MKTWLFFLLCLLLSFVSSIENNDFPFEKKVWTYWHDDNFDQAPLLVRLCEEQIRLSALKVGFQYTRLNKQSVRNYITNYDERITKVRQKSRQDGMQFEADLLRLRLIQEHGGIWMDITEVLQGGFDWLLNIKSDKYKNLITNRFSDDPDVLLFYFEGYQNTHQYRIAAPTRKNEFILYNEFPGYEIWFLAAKKNSSLLGDIADTYSRFTQLDYVQMAQIYHDEEIYMNNVDFGSYLTGNMAICYALQKRQKQLDNNRSIFSKPQSVYEHYKLWSISGILGPLTWTANPGWAIDHLIQSSPQQYESRGAIILFFVKLLGWFKDKVGWQFDRLVQIFTERGLTFEQFLASNPNEQECGNIRFLVEDSLLYPVFENSDYLKSGKIKAITKSQKQQWYAYCSKYKKDQVTAWKEQLFFQHIIPVDVPWYKAHQTVNFDKVSTQTVRQRFNDLLQQKYASIVLFLKVLVHFSAINVFGLLVISISQGIGREIFNCIQPAHEKYSLSPQEKRYSWESFLMIILIGTLSFYQYFMIDFFGYRDDPLAILIVLVIVFSFQHYIQEKTRQNDRLKSCYNLSYLFINFCTTYLCFCLMRRYKVILIYCAIIVGLLGPCLLKIYEKMESVHRINNPLLQMFKNFSNKSYFRLGSILVILIFYLFPTSRYIVINDHYLISLIPILLSAIVVLLYLMLLVECIKTKAKLQVLNMIILGGLSWYLYDLVFMRNKILDQNQRRIAWNITAIVLYQTVYIQFGSSFMKQTNQIQFSSWNGKMLIKYLLTGSITIFVFFGGFYLEINRGYFLKMQQIPYNLSDWFKEMGYLALNCLLIEIYVSMRSQFYSSDNLQDRRERIEEFESSEMVEHDSK